MTDNITYQIDRSIISQQNMQFSVINRRPKYTPEDIQTVKEDIERQLFPVFQKYLNTTSEPTENDL